MQSDPKRDNRALIFTCLRLESNVNWKTLQNNIGGKICYEIVLPLIKKNYTY